MERVAAQFSRGFESVKVASSDRGVNTNAQAAIHPGGKLRFRLRFGAVFVFGVEFGNGCERLLWHAHVKNRLILKHSILAHAPNRPSEDNIFGKTNTSSVRGGIPRCFGVQARRISAG